MEDEPFTSPSKVDPRYRLRCKPKLAEDGNYLANVVICRTDGVADADVSLAPDVPSFETQRKAADAGYVAGEQWLQERM